MTTTMISSGHFYPIWINLTAYHTADINTTTASQFMSLIRDFCEWTARLCLIPKLAHMWRSQLFSASAHWIY